MLGIKKKKKLKPSKEPRKGDFVKHMILTIFLFVLRSTRFKVLCPCAAGCLPPAAGSVNSLNRSNPAQAARPPAVFGVTRIHV